MFKSQHIANVILNLKKQNQFILIFEWKTRKLPTESRRLLKARIHNTVFDHKTKN